MKKTVFDDGFQSYLTDGAELVGEPGIPMLMRLDNVQKQRPARIIVSIFTFISMTGNFREC